MDDETVVDVLRPGREPLTLVVSHEGRCDLGVVDAIAWVCLAAHRAGERTRVRTSCCDVVELLELTGLDEHTDIVCECGRDPA